MHQKREDKSKLFHSRCTNYLLARNPGERVMESKVATCPLLADGLQTPFRADRLLSTRGKKYFPLWDNLVFESP